MPQLSQHLKSNRVLVVLLGGLLLCCAAGAVLFIVVVPLFRSLVQDRMVTVAVLDQFMRSGQQQDAQAGFRLFAIGVPQTLISVTAISSLFHDQQDLFNSYQSLRVENFRVTTDSRGITALLVGTVVYTNHADVTYNAYFLKQNNTWKLLSVEFPPGAGLFTSSTPAPQTTPTPRSTTLTPDPTVTALAALTPQTAADYYKRGILYASKNDYQDALADYDVALRLQPDYADALYNRGYIYALQNDTDKALDDFSNAIRLQPTNEVFYNGRGIVYTTKQEYPQALADLSQSIQLKPDFVAAYLNRGNVYKDLKDYDAAIKDYDRCIQLDSQFAKPYLLRGIAYVDKGNYSQARLDWEMVLQMKGDPADQEVARRNLQQLPPTPTP